MRKWLLLTLLFAVPVYGKPVQIWISSFQDQTYYENMVKMYQEKVDKDFTATVTSFGFREMPDKLAMTIKTGKNGPDIVQLDEIFFGIYLGRELPFVDLTERAKKANLDKDILKERMSLFTYENKTYGIPQSLGAVVLFYRKDQFEEHGLKEADLATWDKLHETGKKLAAKDQKLLALDWSYFDILLRQRGSDMFDAKGNPFPDKKAAIEVLTYIKKLHDDGIGQTPDRGSIFDPVFFSGDIENNEVLSVIGADWYGLDMIQQFAPHMEGQWRAMPLPAWTLKGKPGRRTSTFAGQGLLIYKGSKVIDKSWDFIKFVMTDKEANAQRFLQGNSVPAYKPAFKDPRILGKQKFFDQSLGSMLVELSKSIPAVQIAPKRPAAIFMLQESIFATMLYGEITPEQAIDQIIEGLKNSGGPPGE